MLERIIKAIKSGSANIITPEMCRAFTLAVNGAFESSGCINKIPPEHIERTTTGNQVKTVIRGIDEMIESSFQQNKLFSELGVPWAKSSEEISLEKYSRFPNRAFVIDS